MNATDVWKIHHLNSIGMPYMQFQAREVRQSKICSSEKHEFSIIFARNSPARDFRPTKFSVLVNYYLANPAEQNSNRSYGCVRRNWASKPRNAVGNGECRICFGKIQKVPLFFWQRLFMQKTVTARCSTYWCSIYKFKNISISQPTVKTGPKILPFLWKVRKMKIFSLITRRKNIGGQKFDSLR